MSLLILRGLVEALQLGYEEVIPALAELGDGKKILVDMPGEIWAEARATRRDDERGRYWYGELFGPVHYYDEEGSPIQRAS